MGLFVKLAAKANNLLMCLMSNFQIFIPLQRDQIMKRNLLIGAFLIIASMQSLFAQCSICTKTASQLGAGPASALNSAIIYLAAAPFAIMGYIGWRWWKNEKQLND